MGGQAVQEHQRKIKLKLKLLEKSNFFTQQSIVHQGSARVCGGQAPERGHLSAKKVRVAQNHCRARVEMLMLIHH